MLSGSISLSNLFLLLSNPICLYVCLSIRLSVCLTLCVYLSACLSVCLSDYMCVYLSACLSVSHCFSLFLCLSVYLSMYLCILLSIDLSLYLSLSVSLSLSLSLFISRSLYQSGSGQHGVSGGPDGDEDTPDPHQRIDRLQQLLRAERQSCRESEDTVSSLRRLLDEHERRIHHMDGLTGGGHWAVARQGWTIYV